jgi:hypothetical protein
MTSVAQNPYSAVVTGKTLKAKEVSMSLTTQHAMSSFGWLSYETAHHVLIMTEVRQYNHPICNSFIYFWFFKNKREQWKMYTPFWLENPDDRV